jgi:hypothetical protein
MATKRPAKPRRTPLQEAWDPATDPERLRELAYHEDEAVRRVVLRNPSLPEDVWREALLDEWPEAWANPMAPIYLLAWTPREDDVRPLESAAQLAAGYCFEDPRRCSLEGKVLLNAKVQEGWTNFGLTSSRMMFLGDWAEAKGNGSAEHRAVVRLIVLCIQTVPDLPDEELQALDLLGAWCAGGEDQRKKAEDLTDFPYFRAVTEACWFAQDPRYNSWNPIAQALDVVKHMAGEQARIEHERLLTDLIRREMPLPPVVA